jgi:hypothetical protein
VLPVALRDIDKFDEVMGMRTDLSKVAKTKDVGVERKFFIFEKVVAGEPLQVRDPSLGWAA